MSDVATVEMSKTHREAIVIDGRDPTFLLYRQTGDDKPDYWPTIRRSGLTAIIADVPWTEDGFRDACVNFATWHERIASQRGTLLVRTVADIERAKSEDRVGFILSSQTPTIIEDDVRFLAIFHALGLRVLQMTYQKRNLLADGCGESADGGVSNFGLAAIAEMNRLGIAIDLSHAGDRTMRETIDASAEPVFFSHSNARSRVNVPRNVPDETLRALAARDGVCGVSAYSAFLRDGGGASGTTLDDYIDMLFHIIDLIGIERVSMGFDVGEFRTPVEVALIGGGDPKRSHDPSTRYVRELMTRSNLPRLTDALLARGMADDDIKAFLGGNLVRFFRSVWRDARA
jgi:membrane dipeptidase